MRLLFATAIMTSFLAYPALAQDTPVPAADLKKLVVGKTINSGGAKLWYGKDGSYTYNGGSPGKYTVSTGKICVNFNAGKSRCDRIVKSGSMYYLINSAGKRFSFG